MTYGQREGGLGPMSDHNQFRTIQVYPKDFLFINDYKTPVTGRS